MSAQTLHFIEAPLAPLVPGNGCPLLTCIFTGHKFMQRLGYLHKPGDKLAVILSEPKKALGLSDCGGCGPLFDNIYFLFISLYSLGGHDVP